MILKFILTYILFVLIALGIEKYIAGRLTKKQIIETMILYFVIFVIGVGIALIWF